MYFCIYVFVAKKLCVDATFISTVTRTVDNMDKGTRHITRVQTGISQILSSVKIFVCVCCLFAAAAAVTAHRCGDFGRIFRHLHRKVRERLAKEKAYTHWHTHIYYISCSIEFDSLWLLLFSQTKLHCHNCIVHGCFLFLCHSLPLFWCGKIENERIHTYISHMDNQKSEESEFLSDAFPLCMCECVYSFKSRNLCGSK